MKKRLEELSVSDFILLMKGVTGVLICEGENESEESLATTVRNILFEYREIVDPAGMKSFLLETEELMKARIRHQLFSICSSMLSFGYVDEIASILEEIGINGSKLGEDRLRAVVKSNLARAKSDIAEIEKSRAVYESNDTDIQRHFDEQTVALMSHFKFQIDTSKMNASIYAHLVARFNREVKMMSAAMKKRR